MAPNQMTDAARKAVAAVYQGQLVSCSKDEYPSVRIALQEKAGTWIDGGDHLRAQIALREVERLDRLHGFEFV